MLTNVDSPGGGAFDSATGNFYVPGGFTATGLHPSMQVWDSGTDTWTDETETMPNVDGVDVTGWAESAVCQNPQTGLVHVVNGIDGTSLFTSHQVYDPSAPLGSRWSSLSVPVILDPGGDPDLDLFFFSQSSVCGFIDGTMYLSGGFGVIDTLSGTNPAVLVPDTWAYDPGTDLWSDTGALMPVPVLWSSYTVAVNRALIVTGGTDDLATIPSTTSAKAYLPDSNSWLPIAPLLTSRIGHGMGSLGTRIIVYGGATGDSIAGFFLTPSTDTCVLPACTWASPGVLMNGVEWFFGWGTNGGVPNVGVAAGGAVGGTGVTETFP